MIMTSENRVSLVNNLTGFYGERLLNEYGFAVLSMLIGCALRDSCSTNNTAHSAQIREIFKNYSIPYRMEEEYEVEHGSTYFINVLAKDMVKAWKQL